MRLDSINFDDEQKMQELKQEEVKIPVGALHYLLQYFYTGGGEPDTCNLRLDEALEVGTRYEFTGHPGLPEPETALRSGTPVDEQFTQFIDAKDAVIEVAVKSDIRSVGKHRLMYKIAEFLRSEGYTNVTAMNRYGHQVEEPFQPTGNTDYLNVQIKIKEL